jgi:hypothetical protein
VSVCWKRDIDHTLSRASALHASYPKACCQREALRVRGMRERLPEPTAQYYSRSTLYIDVDDVKRSTDVITSRS